MKPRLLVVDDERDYLDMLQDALGDGYSLLTATSAADGIALFRREADVQLAVIDYMMPGGNGIRLAKAIVESRRAVPMVIWSAYLPSGMREWEAELTLRVIAKSEGPEALLRAIAQILGPAQPAGRPS
jgi:CheY-like chemotaxis protein